MSKSIAYVPLHMSHPVEIHDRNGTIYKFTSTDHANDLIERWNIDVVKVTTTKVKYNYKHFNIRKN